MTEAEPEDADPVVLGEGVDCGRWLHPLPAPVGFVEAPATFSPSHLGVAEECLLRAILGSTRSIDPLPAPPEADRGSAFHSLMERAVRGQIERRGSAEEDAKRALDEIVTVASAKFASRQPPGAPADLRSVWPPAEWRRKSRLALDVAVRYLNESGIERSADSQVGAMKSAAITLDFENLPTVGTWAEVRMRVPGLRTSGRADLVTKEPGLVVVTDLKTGRAVDGEGTIRHHIVLQLRLYGLMARKLAPGRRVRLVVDDGVEHEVGFTDADADTLESWLESVLAPAPPGVPIPAETIARFGPACDGCGFRHACPVYRASAPAAWVDTQAFRLPLDVWGTVESMEATSPEAVRVVIRDDASRLCSVTGLHPARVRGVSPGDRLYLFALKTRDRVGGAEAWRQPRNFFEAVPGDRHNRAWAVAAYASPLRIARESSST